MSAQAVPRVTVVDNRKGDWRRIYLGGDLIAEGAPSRINLVAVLRHIGTPVKQEVVDEFDLLGEAGGEVL